MQSRHANWPHQVARAQHMPEHRHQTTCKLMQGLVPGSLLPGVYARLGKCIQCLISIPAKHANTHGNTLRFLYHPVTLNLVEAACTETEGGGQRRQEGSGERAGGRRVVVRGEG